MEKNFDHNIKMVRHNIDRLNDSILNLRFLRYEVTNSKFSNSSIEAYKKEVKVARCRLLLVELLIFPIFEHKLERRTKYIELHVNNAKDMCNEYNEYNYLDIEYRDEYTCYEAIERAGLSLFRYRRWIGDVEYNDVVLKCFDAISKYRRYQNDIIQETRY